MFKLYNPFKTHIIEDNGHFYIRRLSLFGFTYLDKDCDYRWLSKKEWNKYKSYDEAINRYKKSKVIVYTL